MLSEVLDLAALGKLLRRKCTCGSPFILSAEVKVRFDAPAERWRATFRCSVCTADWTGLAKALTALDHRKGPRTAAHILAPSVWDAHGS